jgi:hypothetical protein
MSSFFWLNAICFDLFWTFWYDCSVFNFIYKFFTEICNRPYIFIKGSVGTTFINQNRFWWYSFYAWTSPLLLTIGVFFNQMFYLENDTFKVDVGDSVCFLNTQYKEKCECQNCCNMKHKLCILIFVHSLERVDFPLWTTARTTSDELGLFFCHTLQNLQSDT